MGMHHTFSPSSHPCMGEVGCWQDSLRQWVPLGTWPGLGCWGCSEKCSCCRVFLASCLCGAAASAWLPLLQCGARGLGGKAWMQERACPHCSRWDAACPGLPCCQVGSLSWGFEHLLNLTGGAFGTGVLCLSVFLGAVIYLPWLAVWKCSVTV